MTSSADACVVGLGGSGLAAVEALVERGLDVVAVDAGRVAAGAAGRNGGFLLGGPDAYLHSAIAAWGDDDAVWLYRAHAAELDHLAERARPTSCAGSARSGWPGCPANRRATPRPPTAPRRSPTATSTKRRCARTASRSSATRASWARGLFLPDDAAMNPARRAIGLAELLQRAAPHCTSTPA